MSGFEIAGVALAIFPIAVGGVTHLVESAETVKHWRRYRLKLRDYAGILDTNRVYLLDTLDELLHDVVAEDAIEDLLSEPGGPKWKEPHHEDRLKKRLGRSYDPFWRTLTTMRNSLSSLCEKIGVDMSGRVLWDEYSGIERELKRIKITIMKNIYKDLLDRIDKANKDLRDITHQNVYLEPIRKSRTRRPIAELRLVREQAASLYRLIVAGQALTCCCESSHIATLRLEQRPKTLDALDSLPRFRVSLSNGKNTQIWPAADSQIREIEIVSRSEAVAVTVTKTSAHRIVRFASDNNAVPETSSAEIAHDLDCNLVADLCTALHASCRPGKAIGFLIDEQSIQRKLYLYPADTPIVGHRSRSLSAILSDCQSQSLNTSFLRSDRLRVALTLASSVLQLNGTSWLEPQWTSDDIVFHNYGIEASTVADYSHPYLRWKLCSAGKNITSPIAALAFDHRSQALLALGFTLVELCFGRTLTSMQTAEDEDTNELATRIRTANRLLRSTYNEMGPSYGDVVRRCLHQPFDLLELSFDNEDFQQKVFDDIVTPLTEILNSFSGKIGSI